MPIDKYKTKRYEVNKWLKEQGFTTESSSKGHFHEETHSLQHVGSFTKRQKSGHVSFPLTEETPRGYRESNRLGITKAASQKTQQKEK